MIITKALKLGDLKKKWLQGLYKNKETKLSGNEFMVLECRKLKIFH